MTLKRGEYSVKNIEVAIIVILRTFLSIFMRNVLNGSQYTLNKVPSKGKNDVKNVFYCCDCSSNIKNMFTKVHEEISKVFQ